MEYKVFNNIIAIKISKNEKVRASIEKVVRKESIKFAKIEAIGAIKDITLGYLQKDSSYKKELFKEAHELLSLKGSVAGDNQIVHMHAAVSNKKFESIGGHFFEATVDGVVEVFITIVSNKVVPKIQQKNDLFPTWKLC